MPAVIHTGLTGIIGPDDHVRDADADLVITARTPIGFDGSCTGHRPHPVGIPIRPGLHLVQHR
jgi:hypothetical protein